MEKIKKRLYNPAFWTGVISLVLLIFSAAGLDFNQLTTWSALWEGVKTILSNPVSVIAVIGALVGVSADPSTKGFLDKE